MKVTYIIKDKTDFFYDKLEAMTPVERYDYLNKNSHGTYAMHGLLQKVGTGQFRDRVELNQIMREPHTIDYKLEPRKGYKLATFQIEKGA